MTLTTSRRSLITGLAALVAAPAIVKVASLMPVNAKLQPTHWRLVEFDGLKEYRCSWADQNGVRMRAVEDYKFFKDDQWEPVGVAYGSTNSKLSPEDVRLLMEKQVEYNDAFGADGAKIGDQLRIRMPGDFLALDGPSMNIQHTADAFTYATLQLGERYDIAATLLAQQHAINAERETVGKLALAAAAAVAVVPQVLATPVTRRFWAK